LKWGWLVPGAAGNLPPYLWVLQVLDIIPEHLDELRVFEGFGEPVCILQMW
jgi:hypothetical protein